MATIEIDGQDISHAVRGFTLTGHVGHRHQLVLDLCIDTGEADGEVQVHIPEDTAALLQALGWTPPGDGLPPPSRLVKVDGVLDDSGAEAAREALRQMEADPHGIKAGLVVQPYTEHGERKWVFRCWGTDDGCDGYLSLDHTSQEWAERARDRHVAEDHQPPITPTNQLANPDIVGTESR